MSQEVYYTLVASLPRLPHFERAEWIPLSRKQLDQRLTMLSEEHARQIALAEELVKWERQPITRTSEQVAAAYAKVLASVSDPSLREHVEFRMSQRTALVALRMRGRGLGPPAGGEIWGVGPWLNRIVAGWERADLGLGTIFPWLEEADRLLKAGDARGLERLLMDEVWTRLGRIAERSPFGIEPVIGFVFRWDILQRWLSYDAESASNRFQELVSEVTREHQQLFA